MGLKPTSLSATERPLKPPDQIKQVYRLHRSITKTISKEEVQVVFDDTETNLIAYHYANMFGPLIGQTLDVPGSLTHRTLHISIKYSIARRCAPSRRAPHCTQCSAIKCCSLPTNYVECFLVLLRHRLNASAVNRGDVSYLIKTHLAHDQWKYSYTSSALKVQGTNSSILTAIFLGTMIYLDLYFTIFKTNKYT